MLELLRLIWDICCLRRGPQDLPYAPLLLQLLCVVSLGLDVLVQSDWVAILTSVVLLAVYLFGLRAVLRARGLGNRFVQTATALFACDLLLATMRLPLQFMLAAEKSAAPSAFGGLLVSAILALLVWKVVVEANIFRHSLNVKFGTGLAISLGWLIFIIYVSSRLAPAAPTA